VKFRDWQKRKAVVREQERQRRHEAKAAATAARDEAALKREVRAAEALAVRRRASAAADRKRWAREERDRDWAMRDRSPIPKAGEAPAPRSWIDRNKQRPAGGSS
jgi:hypothetical protein